MCRSPSDASRPTRHSDGGLTDLDHRTLFILHHGTEEWAQEFAWQKSQVTPRIRGTTIRMINIETT
jgi:hypothetical protein